MTATTADQVKAFFARSDVDFINCPQCEKPIRKAACDKRQRSYGHYELRDGEELDIVSLRFAACEGCHYYNPVDRKKGKLTNKERNRRTTGFKENASTSESDRAKHARYVGQKAAPLRYHERNYD